MTDTPTDTVIVEETTRAIVQADPTQPPNLFGVDRLQVLPAAVEVATQLTALIEDRHMFVTMGKDKNGVERRHITIDGWQTLAAIIGLDYGIEWVKEVHDADGRWREPIREMRSVTRNSQYGPGTYTKEELVMVDGGDGWGGWQARSVVTQNGRVVSSAESECRWTEGTWRTRDSYTLKSMAQTRAMSRALRGALGYIVNLAGFNATPAEEMTQVIYEKQANNPGMTSDQEDAKYYCPNCVEPVYDNRTAGGGAPEKGPAFKCSNSDCGGGRAKPDGGAWPWSSFSTSFFSDQQLEAAEIAEDYYEWMVRMLASAASTHGLSANGDSLLQDSTAFQTVGNVEALTAAEANAVWKEARGVLELQIHPDGEQMCEICSPNLNG